MHSILVYSDSLSWGIIPNTRERLDFPDRWPGVMENELRRREADVRVIEDCLNGRRTVWDDPNKPGRNGLDGLEQRIEINSPLTLVLILLGTNDFQSVHRTSVRESAAGLGELVGAIRRAPIEPGMSSPAIMLVAPPPVQNPRGEIAAKFQHAEARCVGLGDAIREVAAETGCGFFDAADVTTTSKIDGVHLDREQHRVLGLALAERVLPFVP